MKIKFIYFCILWLNAFPVKSGISSTHSPQELMVRWKLDYKQHCRVEPGTYCMVHDEPMPSNSMAPRTHTAIALGPTGNMQGNVKFYCLATGRVLKQRCFTPMAMSSDQTSEQHRPLRATGHMDGNGPLQDFTRGENESSFISTVPEGVANWKDQRTSLYQWRTTTGIHTQGRSGVTNSVNGINIHNSVYSSTRTQKGQMT